MFRLLRESAASMLGLLLLSTASPAHAQTCSGGWLTNNRVGAFAGTGNAILAWDPDGAGPLGELIVIAGLGTMTSGQGSSNICTWDPVTGVWGSMNGGVNGRIWALTTDKLGRLIAAGTFTTAGGVAASNIAAWDGATWSPLGAGVGAEVFALATLSNGDVIAGGSFTTAGGAAASRVARWNGTSWSSFPNAINNNVVDIKPFADGTFAVCGTFFNTAGTSILGRIAKWDGTKWVGYAQGMNASVTSIETLANGDLIACGEFSTADAKNIAKIARWNGTTWVAFNAGVDTPTTYPKQLYRRRDGTLLLAASTGPATGPITRNAGVLSWSGVSWSNASFPIASSTSSPHVTTESIADTSSGKTFFGGYFGPVTTGVYEWFPSGLLAAPSRPWFDGAVRTVEPHPDGGFVIGGAFTIAGGVPAKAIVKVNGDNWQNLGAGLNGTVESVLVLPNGDIVAGGSFTFTDYLGVASKSIALWSQGRWNRFDAGIDGTVFDLVQLPGGAIVAGGTFIKAGTSSINNLAFWNGTTWAALPGGAPNGAVYALANGRSGALYVGGAFGSIGGITSYGAAHWTGTEWLSMTISSNSPIVYSLAVMPNGLVVAGGRFTRILTTVTNIGIWDGFGWGTAGGGITATAGTPTVYAIEVTPAGEIIAGGAFDLAGGVAVTNLARFSGTAWSPMGVGANNTVDHIARTTKGNFLVGGSFSQLGATPARSFCEWHEPAGLTVLSQPQDALSCAGADVSFESMTDGNGTKSYRWQIEDPAAVPFGWRDINDGPLLVNGKQIALAANTKSGSEPLQLTKLRGLSPIKMRFLVYNDCGALLSRTATLRIHAADFNCDNIYDDLDFQIFASAYDILACEDPAMPAACPADLNADGVVDDQDFGEFIVAYNAVIPD